MAELHAISYEQHGNKRWQKSDKFNFAKNEAVSMLLVQELPAAHLVIPIGFALSDGGYLPAAIQGLRDGQNLYVGPAGEWLGPYIPLAYRNYPFQLGKKKDSDEKVLCIDESSGAITTSNTAEVFFINENTPSEALIAVFKSLMTIDKEKEKTRQLCDLLKQHGLIEEWQIKIKDEREAINTVMGFYRINEAALNAVPADVLVELRDSGALLLAYCQLLSMRNLPLFAKMKNQQIQAAKSHERQSVRLSDDNGIISFDNL